MFRRKLQFLVKWEGYGIEHNSWEYSENVANAQEEVADFYVRNPTAPRRICATVFSTIPFRPIGLPTASSRCLPRGGVIVRGTPYDPRSRCASIEPTAQFPLSSPFALER